MPKINGIKTIIEITGIFDDSIKLAIKISACETVIICLKIIIPKIARASLNVSDFLSNDVNSLEDIFSKKYNENKLRIIPIKKALICGTPKIHKTAYVNKGIIGGNKNFKPLRSLFMCFFSVSK